MAGNGEVVAQGGVTAEHWCVVEKAAVPGGMPWVAEGHAHWTRADAEAVRDDFGTADYAVARITMFEPREPVQNAGPEMAANGAFAALVREATR